MKKLIIIILVLIILGLYFYTDATKEVLSSGTKVVGSTVADVGEKAVDKAIDKIEDTDTVKDLKEKLSN
ncbi:MAG: hypothetical protein Q8R00_00640 [Candidatus Nanoarchaeia archaeon]|nr:hypothetical protein [Candidatus Nanoarchaeia archaeon]